MIPTAAQFHELEIPANGTRTAWGEGDSFLVVESNVRLEILRDGAPFLPYEQGDREDLPAGISFQRLEVRNPTLIPAKVKLYSGYGRRSAQRQAVIEPRTRVEARNGVLPVNTDPASVIDLSASYMPGDIRRKSITITNVDPNNALKLCDPVGAVFQTIFPETSVILPISEGLFLKNPNAAAVAYEVGSIYWIA